MEGYFEDEERWEIARSQMGDMLTPVAMECKQWLVSIRTCARDAPSLHKSNVSHLITKLQSCCRWVSLAIVIDIQSLIMLGRKQQLKQPCHKLRREPCLCCNEGSRSATCCYTFTQAWILVTAVLVRQNSLGKVVN